MTKREKAFKLLERTLEYHNALDILEYILGDYMHGDEALDAIKTFIEDDIYYS